MTKMDVLICYTGSAPALRLLAGCRVELKQVCEAALLHLGFLKKSEVGIRAVPQEEIRALNAEFRGVDRVTDVLSFPLGENGFFEINPENGRYMLGDIVICPTIAKMQAEEFGHSFPRELCFLTAHSMLHLFGFDHEQGEDARKEMRRREEEILEAVSPELKRTL